MLVAKLRFQLLDCNLKVILWRFFLTCSKGFVGVFHCSARLYNHQRNAIANIGLEISIVYRILRIQNSIQFAF